MVLSENPNNEKSLKHRSRVRACESSVDGGSVAGRGQILQGLEGTGAMSVLVAGMTMVVWRLGLSWQYLAPLAQYQTKCKADANSFPPLGLQM